MRTRGYPFLLIICIAMLLSSLPGQATPAPVVNIIINGKPLDVGQGEPAPFIDLRQNRALVPMRATLEALGVRLEWNPRTRTAIASNARHNLQITVDQWDAIVDGRKVRLDTPPQIVQNRMFLPLRFTAESLGAQVTWDPHTYTATITNRTETRPVTAEQFIRDLMLALYHRPALLDSSIGPYVLRLHDTTRPTIREEISRALAEMQAEYHVARELGLEFRSSHVETDIRSLHVTGNSAQAQVEATVKWYWGYHGKPTESPMETFNLHHLELIWSDGGWLVTKDQNLASAEKPPTPNAISPVKTARAPRENGLRISRVEGGPGGGASGSAGPDDQWYERRCDTEWCDYNRQNAVQYALTFYRFGNPSYVNYGDTEGGDCTNFTSQALLEGGGLPISGNSVGKDGWWYNKSDQSHSWAWSIANSQARWLREHGYGDYIRDDHRNPVNLAEKADKARELRLGDLIYYDWQEQERSWMCLWCIRYRPGDDVFDHSAMITGFDTKGFPLVTFRNAKGRKPGRNMPWTLSTPKHLVYGLKLHDRIQQR